MTEQIRANKRRSALLIAAFTAIVVAVGGGIGVLVGNGVTFALVAVATSAVVAFVSYRAADRIALAVSRARPAPVEQYPRLHNLVESLCITGGLPKPAVYVIDDAAPNAFATGRNANHSAIVVTTGLLDTMDRVELEGLIAHELSHIRNDDILVSTLAVTMVGAVSLVGDLAIRTKWWNGGRIARPGDHRETNNPVAYIGFILLAFAPIVGKAMQVTIARERETLADIGACQLTRYPPGLISALEKLQADTTVTHSASSATAHLWTVQALSGVGDDGKLGAIHRKFDTHPPLDERIALLREL